MEKCAEWGSLDSGSGIRLPSNKKVAASRQVCVIAPRVLSCRGADVPIIGMPAREAAITLPSLAAARRGGEPVPATSIASSSELTVCRPNSSGLAFRSVKDVWAMPAGPGSRAYALCTALQSVTTSEGSAP